MTNNLSIGLMISNVVLLFLHGHLLSLFLTVILQFQFEVSYKI